MKKIIFLFALIFLLNSPEGFCQLFKVKSSADHPYKHKPTDLRTTGSAASDGQCLTYDAVTAAFEWGTCGSGSGGGSGDSTASGWTDVSTRVQLVTSTDNVTIGGATTDGKLYVIGDTNEKQLQVRGNSTQTANLLRVEKSNGQPIFTVDETAVTSFIDLIAPEQMGLTELSDVNSATQGAGRLLVSDGNLFNSTTISGDITVSSGGVTTIGANTVVLTTDTTGNYALGDAEAGDASAVDVADTRAANDDPDDYPVKVKFDFKENATNGLADGGTYNGVMTWRSYGTGTDLSGGPAVQIANTFNKNLWTRFSTGATSWSPWRELLDVNSATATAGRMLIGDGNLFSSVAMSGDATVNSAGAVTIANSAFSLTELSDVNSATQGVGRILVSDGNQFNSTKLFAARDDLIDVRAYGAVCNGSTDDTVAIQAAITAANGAGAVFVPRGLTCIVGPTAGVFFTLTTNGNYKITGGGTLKVKASSGDWHAMFGPASPTYFNSFILDDITIDYNSANNVYGNSTLFSRSIVYTAEAQGSYLKVNNVRFINIENKNTIISGTQNTEITNSYFGYYCSGTDYHDNAAIYSNSENVVIANNIFVSSVNCPGGGAAIETHGGSHVVTGNIIDGLERAGNITGQSLEDSKGVIITDNTAKNVYAGFSIFSSTYSTHTTGYGVDQLIISNNIIEIAQNTWTTQPTFGTALIGDASGILNDENFGLDARNIDISNNYIVFELSESGDDTVSTSTGIGLYDTQLSDTNLSNLKINGNTVINAPAAAILVDVPNGSSWNVSNNNIINPGSTLDSTLDPIYKTGIFLRAPVSSSSVTAENNFISDTLATSRMVYSYYLGLTTPPKIEATINLEGTNLSSFIAPIKIESGPSPVSKIELIEPNSNVQNTSHFGGNIGIGTSSALANLDVRGSIYSKGNTYSRSSSNPATYFDSSQVMQISTQSSDTPLVTQGYYDDTGWHAAVSSLNEVTSTNLLKRTDGTSAYLGLWYNWTTSTSAASLFTYTNVAIPELTSVTNAKSQRVQYTGVGADVADNAYVLSPATAIGSLIQNDQVTFSVFARRTGANTGLTFTPTIIVYDAASAFVTSHAGTAVTLDTAWRRFSYTVTLSNASTNNVKAALIAASIDNGDVLDYEIAFPQLEKQSSATSYIPTKVSAQTRNGASSTTVLFLNANVGISDSTPTEILEVGGNVNLSTGGRYKIGGAALSLTGLSDVNSNTQGVGRILVSDGAKFNSATVSGCSITPGGLLTCPGSATELVGLSDVNSSTQGFGRILISDGSQFNSAAVSGCTLTASGALSCPGSATDLIGLSDVNSSTQGQGRILISDGNQFNSTGISGDETINQAGVSTIATGAVTSAKILDDTITATDIASVNSLTATSGRILVADGNGFNSIAMSGDTTIDLAGAVAIGSSKVTSTMIVDDTITAADIANVNSITATSGRILIADGNGFNSTAVTGCTLLSSGSLSCPGSVTALVDLSDVNSSTQGFGRILISDTNQFNSAAMSGDVAITASGATTIQADSVALGTDTTGGYATSSTEGGSASTLSGMNITTQGFGRIVVSDGNNFNSTTMSGDITIIGNGTTAIGSSKVTSAMIVDDTITAADIASVNSLTATSGRILIADGNGFNSANYSRTIGQSVKSPTNGATYIGPKFANTSTVSSCECLSVGGTSIPLTLQQCNGSQGACGRITNPATCTTSTTAMTLSGVGTLTGGNDMNILLGTASGSVTDVRWSCKNAE